MGFFDALRRVLGTHPGAGAGPPGGDGLEPAMDEHPVPAGPPEDPGAYDRIQWRRKLKRILDDLPGAHAGWDELLYEARALELDPKWVEQCQREEFLLLIRRAVSDRVVTEEEHRKLEQARALIAMPEAEAEAALHAIVADAESFFGKPVREA